MTVRRHGVGALLLGAYALAPALDARAFSDGPPWDGHVGKGCAACHFGTEPAEDSAAVRLDGLPPQPVPGETYPLALTLADEAAAYGFLIVGPGRFAAPGDDAVAVGGKARSTTAAARPHWALAWTAPATPGGCFDIWINAADNDASAFGDRIHHRLICLGGAGGHSSGRP